MKLGYIDSGERACLKEIYKYNPLLFDLVLKRVAQGSWHKEASAGIGIHDERQSGSLIAEGSKQKPAAFCLLLLPPAPAS